ncbi:uncharacterized protein METZ01_LOCUS231521 [marine metagenome]|uniref:Uncharacterized protein n=1 Tax=marine metagenome TaxID=408172 RepID=A0A382GVE2_9ZZZZ
MRIFLPDRAISFFLLDECKEVGLEFFEAGWTFTTGSGKQVGPDTWIFMTSANFHSGNGGLFHPPPGKIPFQAGLYVGLDDEVVFHLDLAGEPDIGVFLQFLSQGIVFSIVSGIHVSGHNFNRAGGAQPASPAV